MKKRIKRLTLVLTLSLGLLASNVVLADHENPGPKPPIGSTTSCVIVETDDFQLD